MQKFLKRWPTIDALAKASLDDVMRMWAGLGYYRRARFLHSCSQIIVTQYAGHFPTSESELRKLPGFGPYTAAAVAAIAFGQKANVVDGNVERVVARLFAIRLPLPEAKSTLRHCAATLLPADRFGDYAQAVMDLGATICTPRTPKCPLCPWSGSCHAEAKDIAQQLPQKQRTSSKPVRRAIAFALINKKGEILLRQRPPEGLLGGMMEIPSSIWRAGEMPHLADVRQEAPATTCWHLFPGTVRHTFSHFELELAVAIGKAPPRHRGHWTAYNKLDTEALPSVMHKIAHHIKDAIMEEQLSQS